MDKMTYQYITVPNIDRFNLEIAPGSKDQNSFLSQAPNHVTKKSRIGKKTPKNNNLGGKGTRKKRKTRNP